MKKILFLITITLSCAISSPDAASTQKPTVGDVFRYMRAKIDSTGTIVEGTKSTMELIITSKDGFKDGRRNLYTYRYDGNELDYFIDVPDNGDVASYEYILAWGFWQIYPAAASKTPLTLLERDTVNAKGIRFRAKATSEYVGEEKISTQAGNIATQKTKVVYTVTVTGEKKEFLGEQVATYYYWYAPRLANIVKFTVQEISTDKDGNKSQPGGIIQELKNYELK